MFIVREPHTPNHCDVITDSQKRVKVVKKERLCFNCLAHHNVDLNTNATSTSENITLAFVMVEGIHRNNL